MEQHPIPQQVLSYEFKLVGDMTLKQFLKAAVGIILALIINSWGIPLLIKWPLMLLAGGGGLLIAFVPFEDRPLETWFLSFIRSIYSPTIYTYQRKINKNWLDLDLTKSNKQNEEDLVVNTGTSVISKKTSPLADLKDKMSVFGVKVVKPKIQDELMNGVKKNTKEILINKSESQTQNLNKTGVANVVNDKKTDDWRDQKTNLDLKTEKLTATGKVLFGSIPMPDIPETPNVVVGMATDNLGKIIDGVIIEVQDEHGNPSRVLKTNSLGQFKTTTPLASGRYLVIAEKDGYNFDRVNIDLKGQIVQPVKIIANN